jgi:hypothetical protein
MKAFIRKTHTTYFIEVVSDGQLIDAKEFTKAQDCFDYLIWRYGEVEAEVTIDNRP